ncbi:MAG: T9SS type A sorting domain-containing protein [Bacteroidia bacterium]|nr:T9SS type A sorting domain-containing protein [Bacteroidia bacterium]
MKRSVLILITLFFALSASSQYKQDVIASAGGFNTATGISISWTLGETIIPNFKSADNSLILTHGFQSQVIITTVEENLETLVTVTVYPNPASDNVNIKFEEAIDDEVNLVLINSQGKPMKSVIIEATTIEKQINLQDLPAGVYYLKLTKGKLKNVYKVVKL